MRLIGLTGGIASGKSTVAVLLQKFGATVIDADALAHKVMEAGTPALEEVREAFPEAFGASGELDRRALAEIVFHDPGRRERLNAIVHPRVRRLMGEAIEKAKNRGEEAVVLDVPLLIEGGLYKSVDEVWLVSVSEETQLSRLMERNNLSREEALARMHSQMPISEKIPFATVVIDNEGSVSDLREQVRSLWTRVSGRNPI